MALQGVDIILLMPTSDHQHRQQDRFGEGGGVSHSTTLKLPPDITPAPAQPPNIRPISSITSTLTSTVTSTLNIDKLYHSDIQQLIRVNQNVELI